VPYAFPHLPSPSKYEFVKVENDEEEAPTSDGTPLAKPGRYENISETSHGEVPGQVLKGAVRYSTCFFYHEKLFYKNRTRDRIDPGCIGHSPRSSQDCFQGCFPRHNARARNSAEEYRTMFYCLPSITKYESIKVDSGSETTPAIYGTLPVLPGTALKAVSGGMIQGLKQY
jgi:hypothetical protein